MQRLYPNCVKYLCSGTIATTQYNNQPIELYAENETLFFNSNMNLEVKFDLNKKGECKNIIASFRGDKKKFKRIN